MKHNAVNILMDFSMRDTYSYYHFQPIAYGRKMLASIGTYDDLLLSFTASL